MTVENKRFKVQQLDHVHIYVGDQYQAAKWYQEILGLEILPEYEASANGGPLTISSDQGSTGLALFRGESSDRRKIVAFRVDGEEFIDFLQRLPQMSLKDPKDQIVTIDHLQDHDYSFSIYFVDPYGNPYELTTYHYQLVKDRLAGIR